MKSYLVALATAATLVGNSTSVQENGRDVNVTAADGVKLRATYYSPGKPGPGMLLLHQCNMDRKSWAKLGTTLAEHGVHVLAIDYRGYGESPPAESRANLTSDIDAALAALVAERGVGKRRVAVGGASCGVNNAVQLARRAGQIKALVLLSGPTTEGGLKYLQEHPDMAIFGAASSEEDFAVSSLRAMVATSTNHASTLRVLNNAGHGAMMFVAEPALLTAVTDWVVGILR